MGELASIKLLDRIIEAHTKNINNYFESFACGRGRFIWFTTLHS
jgi:hypothetical protein